MRAGICVPPLLSSSCLPTLNESAEPVFYYTTNYNDLNKKTPMHVLRITTVANFGTDWLPINAPVKPLLEKHVSEKHDHYLTNKTLPSKKL